MKISISSVLSLAGLLIGAPALSAQTLEDPIAVPVHISVTGTLESGIVYPYYPGFSLTLDGLPSTPGGSDGTVALSYGSDYDGDAENFSGRAFTRLEPDKYYTVNIGADDVESGATFSIAAPPGYTAEIDGVIQPTVPADYTFPHTVRILSNRQVNVARSGTSSSFSSTHAYWQVSVGALESGDTAGWISISDLGYGADISSLFTPAALNYTPASPEVTVYYDPTSGNLSQILSNDVWVNVSHVTSNSYELDFYARSATWLSSATSLPISIPVPPATVPVPYISYVISEGGTANEITITSTDSAARSASTTLTRTYSGSWPYAWALQDWHTGATALVNVDVANALSTSSTETTSVKDGSGTTATTTGKTYYQYGWGAELASKTLGSISPSDTTSYAYYTGSTAVGSYEFLQSSTENGHWVGYEYQANSNYDSNDGIISAIHRQYIDSSTTLPSPISSDGTTSEITSYSYEKDAFGMYTRPTLIQTQRSGTTVAYAAISYDDTQTLNGLTKVIASRTDWANNSGSSTLSSETRYYREDAGTNMSELGPAPIDPFYASKVCSVTRADGTKDSYAYQRGTWSDSAFTASGTYWNSNSYITSGLGAGTSSCTTVIHGTIQSTNTNSSGTSDNTQITTIGASPYYYIEPVYVVANESTQDITIRDQYAHVVYAETDVWTGSGWQNVKYVTYAYNTSNQLTTTTTNNGEISVSNGYTGELLTCQSDAASIGTTYSYDAAGRVSSIIKAPATLGSLTTAISYDAASHVTQQEIGSSITTSATYDDAGRVSETVDPNAGTTSYSYSPSTWTTTATLPNGGTRIDLTYPDGHLETETGTGVVARYFTYTTGSDGTLTTQVCYNSSGDPCSETVETDVLGRTAKTTKPTFENSATYTVQNTYDSTYGWLDETTRGDGTNSLAPILYQYDSMAQCYRQGLDIAGTGSLALGGADRITDSVQDIEENSSNWWATKKTITYPGSSSSTPFTTSIVQQRLTGFGSNELADQLITDSYGTVTETVSAVNTSANTVTQTTSNPGFSSSSTAVSIAGLTTSQTDFAGLTTTIGYDSLWRPSVQTDSRGNAITTYYKTGNTLVDHTADATGTTLASYTYDNAGMVTAQANANGQYTRTCYDKLNHVLKQWGDIPYPVSYTYNDYGQRATMSTYQGTGGGSGWSSASWPGGTVTGTTTWTYDDYTGLLESKADSVSATVGFTYTTFGQTYKRTWARGTTSTYGYDAHTGELTGITYSDSTPSVSYAYTRSGQLSTVSDATGTHTFNYNNASYPMQQTSEKLDSTFYGGLYLSRLYTTSSYTGGTYGPYTPGYVKGMMIGYELGTSEGNSSILYRNWNNSEQGQFMGVHTQNSSSTARDLIYTYQTSSNLISGYTDDVSSFAVTRSYETQRDLLTSIQGKWSGSVVTEFDYLHNPIYQTSSVTQSGPAFSNYGSTNGATFRKMTYDSRGELLDDIGYLGSNLDDTSAPLPDRGFTYRYDNIGDRTCSSYTGSTLNESYSVNSLNQYTARENLTVPVSGSVANNPSANVTLSTSSSILIAGRQGGLWAGEALPPNDGYGNPVNESAPAVFSLTLNAGWPGAGTGAYAGDNLVDGQTLSLTIPPSSQSFTYDADGNLTADNMWTYTYDAENRLIGMVTSSAAVTAGVSSVTIAYAYDYLGRRVEKSVTTGAGTTVHRFIYDGWNLIADYLDTSGTLSVHRTFTWGLDVTGDLTAAGGVGALLELTNFNSDGSTTDYFPTYDGNGNIASLINGSSGAIAAVYEYSSFGESLRPLLTAADSAVADNPFRFSTKFTDVETGLIYYGHRYYSPHLGRFINRDPVEESGGINLYGFVNNDPANGFDVLGFDSNDTAAWQVAAEEEGYSDDAQSQALALANSAGQTDVSLDPNLSAAGEQTPNPNGSPLANDYFNAADYGNLPTAPGGNAKGNSNSATGGNSGSGQDYAYINSSNVYTIVGSPYHDSILNNVNYGQLLNFGGPTGGIRISWSPTNGVTIRGGVTFNVTTVIKPPYHYEKGVKSSQTIIIDPGSGLILSDVVITGTTNILGVFPSVTARTFGTDGFAAFSSLELDGTDTVLMAGSTGSMAVPPPGNITYLYTISYDPSTGDGALTGENKDFPTYTVSVNNTPIFVSPQSTSGGIFAARGLYGGTFPVGLKFFGL